MAYVPYYTINFTNEQNQIIEVTISKKDGDPDTVSANYECTDLSIEDKSEGQTKYESTIITKELILGLWTTETDEITWETFITAEHDEWYVLVNVDSQTYFEGWLTPDEGNALFQDKPYEVTIRATNGLALLKDVSLVKADGNDFTSDHQLIEYIAGALNQTGLALPIRCCCQYFNEQMNDKADGLQYDMFGQTYLNYRTFLSDATTFVSCYDALKIILDKFCRLEYWDGFWLIKSIAELQYVPAGADFYVNYDSNGQNPTGVIETHNHAQIGKAVDIYPINEDQQIYSRYAIKSAKTIYNYVVWPEIPKNNKFERGTLLSTTSLGGGFEERRYSIPDWTFGWAPSGFIGLPSVNTPSDASTAYRLSVFNQYNVEESREIVVDSPGNSQQEWLQSEAIPVRVNDKVKIGFDHKTDFSLTGNHNLAYVYIVPTAGGSKIWLDNLNHWRGSGFGAYEYFYDNGENTNAYVSFSLEPFAIPVDGNLYVAFHNNRGSASKFYYKNFTFEYQPYVAGSLQQVKGDFWIRQQNKVFPDVASEEVLISDSPRKVLKGAMLVASNSLTTPTWYRYGISESRHFKELLNIARFNHSYRRMYAIEGTFNGLNFAPENHQLVKEPLAFHKRYRMVDMVEPRDFVLVPPLKMNIIKGWISANLVEVRKDADGDTDGTQTGNSSEFKYIF